MGVFFPFIGYVERQAGEADAVRNDPTSGINKKRIERISEKIAILNKSARAGHVENTNLFNHTTPEKWQEAIDIFGKDMVAFETDDEKRPMLYKIIKFRRENRNMGSIVITKTKDIFHDSFSDDCLTCVREIIDTRLPVLPIENFLCEETLTNIKFHPEEKKYYFQLADRMIKFISSVDNLQKKVLWE